MNRTKLNEVRQKKSEELFKRLAELKKPYKKYMMGIDYNGNIYAKIILLNGEIINI